MRLPRRTAPRNDKKSSQRKQKFMGGEALAHKNTCSLREYFNLSFEETTMPQSEAKNGGVPHTFTG